MALAGYEAVGRFAEMVYRVFGEELEFLPPGLILELDRAHWKLLKRERSWCSGVIPIGAAAANNSRVQILNPTGSGLLVVVEGAGIINKTTAGLVSITIDAAAAATPTSNIGLDTRPPTDALGQVSVASKNLIANGNAVISGYRIERFSVAALSDGFSRLLPVKGEVLSPGHNCTLFNETVNEALNAIFWGYEVPVRPEELVL